MVNLVGHEEFNGNVVYENIDVTKELSDLNDNTKETNSTLPIPPEEKESEIKKDD